MTDTRGFTVWLTGLPCSGKSSLAEALARAIRDHGLPVEVIDSGKLRHTPLGATLGFTKDDRDLNVRRHALAARLLVRNGVVAVVAAVSPHRATRDLIREELKDLVEVWVATPKAACIDRDSTGLWSRALRGEIRHFTGVDDPYEEPLHPEVVVDLSKDSLEEAVARIMAVLSEEGRLPGNPREAHDGDSLARKLSKLGYSE